jgi:hypothetical protein
VHLSEALEQKAATSDVLRVIFKLAGRPEACVETLLANATRL